MKNFFIVLFVLCSHLINGQVLIEYIAGSTGTEYGKRFFELPDKGFLLFGNWDTEEIISHSDVWVQKIDSLGNYEWDITYPYYGMEYVEEVTQLSTGDYLLYGYTGTTTNAVITKIGGDGSFKWRKTWIEGVYTRGKAILNVSDSTFLTLDLIRYSVSSPHDSSAITLNLRDTLGNVIWRKSDFQNFSIYTHGGEPNGNIIKLHDNHYLWTYPKQDSVMYHKVDALGNTIWRKGIFNMDHNQQYFSRELPGGHIATNANTSLVLLDSMANQLWAVPSYKVQDVCFINDTCFYVLGYTYAWFYVDLDIQAYVSKYTIEGNKLFTKKYTDAHNNEMLMQQVKTTNDKRIGLIGYFHDPYSPFYYQLIFVKMDTLGPYIGIDENNLVDSVNDPILYPNPSYENVLITTNDNQIIENIRIFNSNGQLIFTSNIKTNKTSINTSKFPNGVYIVKVHTNKGTGIKKLVVQHE